MSEDNTKSMFEDPRFEVELILKLNFQLQKLGIDVPKHILSVIWTNFAPISALKLGTGVPQKNLGCKWMKITLRVCSRFQGLELNFNYKSLELSPSRKSDFVHPQLTGVITTSNFHRTILTIGSSFIKLKNLLIS